MGALVGAAVVDARDCSAPAAYPGPGRTAAGMAIKALEPAGRGLEGAVLPEGRPGFRTRSQGRRPRRTGTPRLALRCPAPAARRLAEAHDDMTGRRPRPKVACRVIHRASALIAHFVHDVAIAMRAQAATRCGNRNSRSMWLEFQIRRSRHALFGGGDRGIFQEARLFIRYADQRLLPRG